MSPPTPRTLLDRYGLRAKRSWSQNFLVDPAIPQRIAAACGIGPDDVVVEIGAGLGHLTGALADRAAHVVAVERDRELVRVLRGELADRANVEIAEENALTLDFGPIAARFGRRLLAVGNLPYHLSSQILLALLDQRAHLTAFVLMFQKELADRIAASPGGRRYGVLSVLARLHTEIRPLLEVPRGAFHPPPKVKSTVLRFDVLDAPRADVPDEASFRRIVHAAFSRRRKTLRNALCGGLAGLATAVQVEAALARAGIDPTARAETLGVEAFAALTRALEIRG